MEALSAWVPNLLIVYNCIFVWEARLDDATSQRQRRFENTETKPTRGGIMKTTLKIAILNTTVASLLNLVGCAHPKHGPRDHHQPPGACEPRPQNPSEAQVGARFDIMGSPNLTIEQKNKFIQVMNETQTQVTSIKQREGDIKAHLFRSLATGKYDRKTVDSAKKQLRKLEDEKMNLMFLSLDRVREILGEKVPVTPDMIEEFQRRMLIL
jgi:hypothetical protein